MTIEDLHGPSNSRLLGKLPTEQLQRVFSQGMCDIDPSFLGFVGIYERLAQMIPPHFAVIDLGCSYAAQAFFFVGHRAYIGVDRGLNKERFCTPNATHHEMDIQQFVERFGSTYSQDTTFAICSYVPPWGADNRKIAREAFENVFTFYPSSDQPQPIQPPPV